MKQQEALPFEGATEEIQEMPLTFALTYMQGFLCDCGVFEMGYFCIIPEWHADDCRVHKCKKMKKLKKKNKGKK